MSYVQSKSKDSGSVTSDTMAFTANVTAGSTLVAALRVGATGRTITVSDGTNTYAKTTEQADVGGNGSTVAYAQNAAAGATTITGALSGAAASLRWAIGEYGGLAAASFDKTTGAVGGSSTSISSGATATTTQATETLVVMLTNADDTGNTALLSAGAGFTLREHVQIGSIDKMGLEDQDVTSTGAYTGTGTLSGANHWAAIIITLKASGGGGGGRTFFLQSSLDGLSSAGPKQFNPSLG